MAEILSNIPKSSAVILIGPPLEGKRDILFELIFNFLKQKNPVLYLTTDISPKELKMVWLEKKMFYGHYEKEGFLKFLDCYSYQSGSLLKDTESIIQVPGPLALNEISVNISDIESVFYKKSGQHLVIFDSLSTPLMYASPAMILRFIQVMAAKIKNAGGIALFMLEEGMHDSKTVISVKHMMDIIIEVKESGGKTMLRSSGLGCFNEWTEFQPRISLPLPGNHPGFPAQEQFSPNPVVEKKI